MDPDRFGPVIEDVPFANELWMLGHGACMRFATGVLPFGQVQPIVASGLAHRYHAAGDVPDTARRSLGHGWARGLDTDR